MYFSCSVIVPFRGDYVGLRRNPLWKDTLKRNRLHRMDRRIVCADIVNKINRSNGKVVLDSLDNMGEKMNVTLVPFDWLVATNHYYLLAER